MGRGVVFVRHVFPGLGDLFTIGRIALRYREPAMHFQKSGHSPVHVAGLSDEAEQVLLVVPRGSDRRQAPEDGPPWITEEGFVLEDRRSGLDRRRGAG